MTPLRPSLLPKLAACPRYEPEPIAGAAADRGTALDVVFRAVICADESALQTLPDEDAVSAVCWAVDTARILAGDAYLEANEENLRIEAACMTGTADLLCEGRNWSADLKTGQVRNYREQQAAYALGFMDRFFIEEWTVYLLFCDERKLERLHFTREEAEEIIREVKARRFDPLSVPTPCGYCGWCASRWKCSQRLETVAWYLGIDPATVDFEKEASDPARLGALLDMVYLVAKDDGLYDMLKAKASEHILAGAAVPGWKMQAGRESKTAAALRIQEAVNGKSLLQLAGSQNVFAIIGNISGAKLEAIWQKAHGADSTPPADWIEVKRGAAYVAKSRSKKES
jgi:hypothetical protein